MTTINDHYNVEVQSRFYAFLQDDRECVEPEALIASVERRKELKKESKSKAKKDRLKEKAEEEMKEKMREREKAEEELKEKAEEERRKSAPEEEEMLSRETVETQESEVRHETSYRGRGGSRRGGRDGSGRTETEEGVSKSETDVRFDGRPERENRGRGGSKRGGRDGFTRGEAGTFNEEGTEKRQYGSSRGRPYRKDIIEEDSFNKVGYFEEQSHSNYRGGSDRRRPYSRGTRSSRGSDRVVTDESYRAETGDDKEVAFDGTGAYSGRGRHPRFERDNNDVIDENVDNTFVRSTRGRYPRSNRDFSDNMENNHDRPPGRGRYQRYNREGGETNETLNDNPERLSSRGGRGRSTQSHRGISDNTEVNDDGADCAPQRSNRGGRYQRHNRDFNDFTHNNQDNADYVASSSNGKGRFIKFNRENNDIVDDTNDKVTERVDNKQYTRRTRDNVGDNVEETSGDNNTSSRGGGGGYRGRYPRPNKGGLNRFSQPNNEEGAQFEHNRMGYFNENVDIRESRGRGRSAGNRGSRRGRGDYHRSEDQDHEENSSFRNDIRALSPPPPIDNWEAVPDEAGVTSPQTWQADNDIEEKTADWGEIEDDPAEVKVDNKMTMTLEEWKALNNKDRILNQTLDGKEIRKANDGQDVFSGMSEYRKGKCVEDVGPEEHEVTHESSGHSRIKKEIPLAVRFSRNVGESMMSVDSERNTYDQGYGENNRTYQRSYSGRGRDNQGSSRGRGRSRGSSDRYERDSGEVNSGRREGYDSLNFVRKEESESSDFNFNRRGGFDYNSGRRGGSDGNSGRRGGSEGMSGRRGGTYNSDFNSRGRGNSDIRSEGRDNNDQTTTTRRGGNSDLNFGKRGISDNLDNDFSSKGGSSFNGRGRGSDFPSRNRGSDFSMYGRGRDFNRGRGHVNRNVDYQGNTEEENVVININLGNEEEFPHLS